MKKISTVNATEIIRAIAKVIPTVAGTPIPSSLFFVDDS